MAGATGPGESGHIGTPSLGSPTCFWPRWVVGACSTVVGATAQAAA
eukprot:SAG22_NODE_7735_length_713_cov_0.788274_2_plen_45_part_01